MLLVSTGLNLSWLSWLSRVGFGSSTVVPEDSACHVPRTCSHIAIDSVARSLLRYW